jgi:hypothetical protein
VTFSVAAAPPKQNARNPLHRTALANVTLAPGTLLLGVAQHHG